ncbi:MAG: hypothetical protein ABSH03_08900 [Candidatus Lustribacter sp.]|jgi:mono/diheme cytochrome c family protein
MSKFAPFVLALVLALGASSLPLRAQAPPNPLPPGDGADIIAVTCSQCHGLNALTQLRMSGPAWRHQIYDMIERGAQVRPDQVDTMVNYLQTHLGPGIPFPGPSPAPVTLAPGNGADVVQTRCSLCHGVDRVVTVKRTPAQWTAILNRMVYYGAPITADQQKAVFDYLSKNYGN